jgi:hypothetical protein
MTDLALRGKVSVGTGAGNDHVIIGDDTVGTTAQATLDAAVHLHGLTVHTGDDNDQVDIMGAALRGHLKIETGIGNDIVSLGGESEAPAPVADGLPGGDLLDLQLQVRGHVSVALGDGNDEFNVSHASAFSMAVFGEDGLDTISVDTSHISHLGVFGGDDEDHVNIVDSVFRTLGVALGGGNDELSTDGLTSHFAALLGGDGEDTHNVVSESDFGHALIRGFELPPDVINSIGLPHLRRPLAAISGIGLGRGLRHF